MHCQTIFFITLWLPLHLHATAQSLAGQGFSNFMLHTSLVNTYFSYHLFQFLTTSNMPTETLVLFFTKIAGSGKVAACFTI